MKNRIGFILLFAIGTILLVGCAKKEEQASNKLKVSVSFNALYEFAQAVGQDKVEVSTIIPNGVEPHDFEPKAADLTKLSKADVFVYNGLGMESWATQAMEAIGDNHLTVVEASNGAQPIINTDTKEVEEHGQYDPHLWISLSGAKIEVAQIADGFSKADPDNEAFYQKNAKEYIGQLEALYQEYQEKFASVLKKNMITGHAAFHYFCQDFGLSQNSVEDVFAEGEPSTKQLAELVEYCKENQVTTIFAEEMASPEISQTLADEVGAEVVTIYTMESEEDNLSYLERMQSNLEKVYQSLSK
ncbi:MAG: zinc transport system substrate-binding protein [Clostridiales bacterium]|nr:zinc transport system substrate-binding protein [Clostridiales bacterium]